MKRHPIASVGRWSAAHPWYAITLWLAFVIAALAALQMTGSKTLGSSSVGESKRGYALLDSTDRGWPPPRDYAHLHSSSLRVGDPAFRSAIADVKHRMDTQLGTDARVRTGAGGHAALVTSGATQEMRGALQTSLEQAAAAHPRIQITGSGPGSNSGSSDKDLHRAET